MSDSAWFTIVAVAFVVIATGSVIRAVRNHIAQRDGTAPDIRGCTIEKQRDPSGGRAVSVGMAVSDETYVRAFLTPDQARELALLLRVAATPGRDLAQARRNAQLVRGAPPDA